MKIKSSADVIQFQILGYLIVGFFGFITIFPFLVLIGSSFAPEKEIITLGYSVVPRQISLEAYGMIFRIPRKSLMLTE